MLLVIQYPLVDARKLLEASSRIPKPVWPLPEPGSEFVRYFGAIRERKAGGLAGWGSENENLICEAVKALTFRRDLSLYDKTSGFRLALRRAFERFYFDGYAVGKYEIGVSTKMRCPVALTHEQLRDAVLHFLHLPVQIRNPLEKPGSYELAQAGKPLARLYLIATTYNKLRTPESLTDWQVQSGTPLVFLEHKRNESVELPPGARAVALPNTYGLELYRYLAPYSGGNRHVWILQTTAAALQEKARLLRLYLLRLHSEHECLRLTLRNVMLGHIVTTRGTKPSDNLQEYFDRAIKRIKKLESRSEQHFTSEIADIARSATDMLSPGTLDTMLASVEKLDPRRAVLRKIQDYVAAAGSAQPISFDLREGEMTTVQGDQISVSGVSGGVVAIKSTMGDVIQNVGNIPGADQATKDELKKLIEQLTDLLQKAPAASASDAEAVAETARQLVDSVAKEKPNKTIVQITAEGLKKAAENIKAVLPDVIPIATQIVFSVLKLAGGG